jgi:hypothetical protein
MKDMIEKIVYDGNKLIKRRLTESYFKKNYNDLYVLIINKYKSLNISFSEMLYLILKNLNEPPVCKMCGSKVSFRKISQGYSKYCSMKCIGNDDEIQKKREETSLSNIGVKYTLQSKEKRDDIKKKNLEKYGVEYPQQSLSVKEKTKKTNLNKYGVEHHLKLKSQQEKQKTTILNNYGVDNPMKSEIIKNRVKKTLLRKYGVDSYSKTIEFKEKLQGSNLSKYGKKYTFQLDEIKKKIKNTILGRYGVDYYSKTPECKNKVKKTKNLKYNDENYNNRKKCANTCMLKYGVDNPSKNIEIKNKIQIKIYNNFKEEYSRLLNICSSDITSNGDLVTINNYCKIHDNFEISKSLLYSRVVVNKYENICTKCNPIAENSSIIENEFKSYIKSLNVNSINNITSILNNKQEIDVYLPEHKLAFEIDGIYWHSNLFKDRNYHLNKTIQCENGGIQLIHIFDDEWIYKKNIIKSMVKSKLNQFDDKIFARKCVVKELDIKTNNLFLDENHLFGSVSSIIRLGLYYNEKLIAVMNFENLRKNLGNFENNNNYYNLNRFCTILNTQVIGGASKLLKHFIKTYNPEKIITYADRRFSNGGLYEKLNFTLVNINRPSYYYFNNNKKQRYHRFNYRKENIIKLGWYCEDKTIDEILLEHHIYKVYDCGTIKYQMDLK